MTARVSGAQMGDCTDTHLAEKGWTVDRETEILKTVRSPEAIQLLCGKSGPSATEPWGGRVGLAAPGRSQAEISTLQMATRTTIALS